MRVYVCFHGDVCMEGKVCTLHGMMEGKKMKEGREIIVYND